MNIIKRNNSYEPSYINLFDDVFGRNWNDFFFGNRNSESTLPSVNISDNEKDYELEVAAPGYQKSDFKVNVENGIMTIKAESNSEKEEHKKNYAHREHFYSAFERRFTLPENVNETDITASYKDGVLSIIIPKKEVEPALPCHEIKIN